MRIIRANDYKDMSRKAENLISAQILLKPDCVLGLATGETPIGVYRQLTEWYRKGDLDFSQVTTVNLDEYKGLSKSNEQSYAYYMQENFFQHINIDIRNTYLPDGMELDSEKACRAYDAVLDELGDIDLQLLGLGHNGHIGFNEPGQTFMSLTHCVSLTEQTIAANQRFFTSLGEVPRQAYTMGIKPIMQAKKVLLVVSGSDKSAALKDALFGPITPQVQASILQLHRDVTVVADEAALSQVDKYMHDC